MKEIINKPWDYKFFELEQKFYLSVICGGVGMYEINLLLNKEEIQKYEKEGITYIDKLAREVQYYTSRYMDRNVEIPQ